MALTRGKSFSESLEGTDLRDLLQQMTLDTSYNTGSSYTADSLAYADGQMPFIDKHMNYLIAHPKLDAIKYLANLRLMTRIR